jgi:glycosyltransferase involved in cell wall biosynthesis
MRIGVTSFGADGGKSGISQYLINLMKAFAAAPEGNEFEVSTYADEKALFVPNAPGIASLTNAGAHRGTIQDIIWHQAALPRLCRTQRYDVLFLPAGNRRLPATSPCPTVGTVHDFSSIHMRNKYDRSHLFYVTQVLPALVRRLSHVITVSKSAKHDIVEFAGVPAERVTVIPNAVDHTLFYADDPDAAFERLASKMAIRRPYLLYLSRLEHPGKNHINLLKAFTILKKKYGIPHQLVLAGSDWDRAEEIHEAAEKLPCASDVLFTGFVASGDVPDLYRAADVMVFPSLLEGFGIPILEAMACGAPVVCSNVSSMPEVAEDAANYFDPADVESMVESIAEVVASNELKADLRARGLARAAKFTWAESAAKTLAVLRDAVEDAK